MNSHTELPNPSIGRLRMTSNHFGQLQREDTGTLSSIFYMYYNTSKT